TRPEAYQAPQAGLDGGIGSCLQNAKQRNSGPLLALVEAEVRRACRDESETSAGTRQPFNLGREKMENGRQRPRRKPFHQVFIIDTVDNDRWCATFGNARVLISDEPTVKINHRFLPAPSVP